MRWSVISDAALPHYTNESNPPLSPSVFYRYSFYLSIARMVSLNRMSFSSVGKVSNKNKNDGIDGLIGRGWIEYYKNQEVVDVNKCVLIAPFSELRRRYNRVDVNNE